MTPGSGLAPLPGSGPSTATARLRAAQPETWDLQPGRLFGYIPAEQLGLSRLPITDHDTWILPSRHRLAGRVHRWLTIDPNGFAFNGEPEPGADLWAYPGEGLPDSAGPAGLLAPTGPT